MQKPLQCHRDAAALVRLCRLDQRSSVGQTSTRNACQAAERLDWGTQGVPVPRVPQVNIQEQANLKPE